LASYFASTYVYFYTTLSCQSDKSGESIVNKVNVKPQAIRILIFGHKEFSQLMTSVLPEFAEKAKFKLFDAIVGSVSEIDEHIRSFLPDVIVSAGSNAAYLKSALDLPVVSLDCSVTDIISAVQRAAQVSRNIVLINFAEASPVVPILEAALNVTIQEEIYTTPEQARELFQLTRQQPNIAYVGASLVCGLATQHGLPSFLLYSAESCRKTIVSAIQVVNQQIVSNQGAALTNWLLKQSKTPIFMTDKEGQSIIFNQAARQELGVDNNNCSDLENLIYSEEIMRPTDGECCIQGVDWWFHQDCVITQGKPLYIYQLYRKKPKPEKVKPTSRHQLVFESSAIKKVMQQVRAFSSSPSNVLIYGESGTGKELIARAVHETSPFSEGNFVALNCSSIPTELFEGELFGHRDGAFTGAKRGGRKGLIEEAQDGVLFLDEISELALDQQSKLLRFLQERHYRPIGSNVEKPAYLKVITASNKELKQLVVEGKFRADLFFRINVFNIHIPPLRERPEDISSIAIQKISRFITSYQSQFSVTEILSETLEILVSYSWPGNVRELENVLERVVASMQMADDLTKIKEILRDISPELFLKTTFDIEQTLVRTKELELVVDAMHKFNGDKQQVAHYLGLSQTTLWRRLKHINLK
jgi:propionate catabolism operon transcriptional regulator